MFVFDASTLILTAKIELLHLFLNDIGMEVAIPKAVEQECCGASKTFDALVIRKALDDSKIKVRKVRDGKLIAKLMSDFSMGRGEAEAIALALGEKARIVGIDDKIGINACKLLGLPFTTAIGLPSSAPTRKRPPSCSSSKVENIGSESKRGRHPHTTVPESSTKAEY